ncbi:unnamed protein product [Dovyalis caffra]|uniref:Uncharacterized protein n=1 Tax=Dovyalis caffra TaxID=77055 RepID=A0AAV1R811_9ROSI|nr:unnamed protein product [Dovyalis caffra]
MSIPPRPDRQQPPPSLLPIKLNKQLSWSPDMTREEVWLRRKGNSKTQRGCGKSLTDDDLDDLKASIELGFGFGPDSPILDPKLSDTLPALGDDPEMVKTRLRQWAQMVACSVKQFSGKPN